jgi:hypothetical protein
MDENDNRVAEILRLAEQKKEAYARLAGLETQLRAGGILMAMLRTLFSSKHRANREELNETIGTIYALRNRIDELHALLPVSRRGEVRHVWDPEYTTNPNHLRKT